MIIKPKAGSVKKTKISQVWKNSGDKRTFLFDYGDDWRFLVELLEIRNVNPKKNYPEIMEKFGKAPEQYPPVDDF